MNPDHILIMQDMYLACAVATALAFGFYHFVRKQSPETGWNYHGNVPTSAYGKIDLIGLSILLVLYFGMLLLASSSSELTDESKKIQEEMSPIALSILTFVSGLITQVIPAGVVLLFVATRYNVFELFGMKHVPWKKVFIWAGIGLVAGYVCIAIAHVLFSSFITSRIGEQELQAPVQMIMDAKKNNPTMLIALVLLASVVAPLFEEFVFRGYMYTVMKRYSCRFLAAISSGLIFALVHVNLWSLPALFVLGVLFAVVYEITGSLWSSITMHAAFNTISIIGMLMINENNLPY